jgi:tetratricopeptide (TPR) repeat protein
VLAAAALGLTLLLAISQGTRRRAAQHGSSPTLPSRGGVPVAPPHQSNSAIAGSPDGRASETLERPAAPGAAFRLGVLLEEQNDLAGAEAAYRRADLQGHAAAASNLGVLLERRGDLRSAKAAYRRADERGDPNGAFNLAVLLEEQNELTAAQAAYRRADQRGPAEVANAARAALLSLREGSGGVHDRNGGDQDVD